MATRPTDHSSIFACENSSVRTFRYQLVIHINGWFFESLLSARNNPLIIDIVIDSTIVAPTAQENVLLLIAKFFYSFLEELRL